MTSCGGMFSVIVRRSTLTIRSTIGIRMKRPGPFGSGSSRPSRKTMPRSYSRATLIAEKRKRTTTKRMTANAMRAAAMGGTLLDRELEALDGLDPHVLAGNELASVRTASTPQFALDIHLAGGSHDRVQADDA